MKKTIRIALCGAGGTGKGTLVKEFSKQVNEALCSMDIIFSQNEYIAKIMFPGLKKFSEVEEQDKKAYQYAILSAQIAQEKIFSSMHDDFTRFISERSVIDYIPYAIKNDTKKEWYLNYQKLIFEYLKTKPYDHLVYVPLEFSCGKKPGEEFKERDIESQKDTDARIRDTIMSNNLRNICNETGMEIFSVSGTPYERAGQIIRKIWPQYHE